MHHLWSNCTSRFRRFPELIFWLAVSGVCIAHLLRTKSAEQVVAVYYRSFFECPRPLTIAVERLPISYAFEMVVWFLDTKNFEELVDRSSLADRYFY